MNRIELIKLLRYYTIKNKQVFRIARHKGLNEVTLWFRVNIIKGRIEYYDREDCQWYVVSCFNEEFINKQIVVIDRQNT